MIYPAPDLAAAKAWYSKVLGFEPYFDQPFYVGYEVGGYELGLIPANGTDRDQVAYWGVADAQSALAKLVSLGATADGEVQDVGEGILVAQVRDPAGNILGIIENPHFTASG